MLQIGIFENVFERPTLEQQFAAVAAAGLASVQFHYASAGLESRPMSIPEAVASEVRSLSKQAGIRISAVSGTFNMIHPDVSVREQGLVSLDAVAGSCHALGTSIITLCTGTRSAASKWKYHPDNILEDAWEDLMRVMKRALAIADCNDVILAFEPEPANVVRNADTARKLLDAVHHPRLKVILDPANIVASDRSRPPAVVLTEAWVIQSCLDMGRISARQGSSAPREPVWCHGSFIAPCWRESGSKATSSFTPLLRRMCRRQDHCSPDSYHVVSGVP